MDVLSPALRLVVRDDDKPSGADELLKLLQDPFQGQLAAASVYSALAISLGVTTFIAICFSFLRPYHQALYAPKVKHADAKHSPPPIGKAPWSWVVVLWKTREDAIVQQAGMDAAIFLRFVRMVRNMFGLLTILGLAILIPINLGGNIVHVDIDDKDAGWLHQITPLNIKGPKIWSQVVVAWLFNAIVAGFLWWNYKKVTQLRRKYFDSEEYQNSLHSRTLMLFDIPKQGCSDEGIARIIDQVVPNSSFARTVVARNVKDLPELIAQHDHMVRKLEKVLAKYLSNPNQLPAARPSCKPSKKDRSYSTYPKGQKLDAIDYYTQRIRDLELEIKQVRASVDKRSSQPYGFASYSDIAEAHNIAYACRKKKPHGTTVVLAPRPNDIIWANMPLSASARSRRRWVNTFWIVLLTLFWIAPNAMIAIFLVNLSNLGKVWHDFEVSLEQNTKVWGIAQGILAPALMSLVYLLLPIIFRRLSMKAGDKTKTGRERHVLGKLYFFFVFNNLIVFTFFSVLWSFVSGVLDQTQHGIDAWEAIVKQNLTLGIFQSLCNNSPFWVTYLLQRELGAAIDLAQLWSLIQAFFMKKFSNPTPRELIELTAPPPFEYASYYNYFLFYVTVTLCLAGIQPLVLPATALYFALDSYLKKYLLLYRFVTKTESGGMFWRVLFNRMIFAVMLSDLVVLLTTWVQGEDSHIQFYATAPLPFVMLGFKFYCRSAFDDKIRFYSTRPMAGRAEVGLPSKENRGRSERLASRFGHPALYKNLITPMVHQKAQNLLPAVYKGRLTDGREAGAGDLMSVSGYSDMYALDAMQGGKPGKAAGGMPGFEFVSEGQMDFEHYKNRAEFAEDHGGGEIYGKQGEIIRPNTPGSFGDGTEYGSRPGSPASGRSTPFGPGNQRRVPTMETSYSSFRPPPGPGGFSQQSMGMEMQRTQSPLYSHDNDSDSSLVRNAVPMASPGAHGRQASAERLMSSRSASADRLRMASGTRTPPVLAPTPGPVAYTGPHGYSGLAQSEEVDPDENVDPTQYDYFRGATRGRKSPGPGGW